ncbi:flagellin [Asticcacaulis sp. 201]|uniref:flagellin n=1 Tax=Asticcacaulis sp. 201 TaxID=3028787 RepID=UPI00291662FE|nr:flagellin [Asticcacaulis sp. 201]MDV6331628.1 flagellin [Asticcacaulis sp. 201]
MLSVATNSGSDSALQGLSALNRKMDTTRDRITSGLKVQTARDDGATFAIATRLKSDQALRMTVQNNLSRAQSILDVAESSAENIGDLLNQMHERALMLNDTSLSADAQQSVRNDLNALNHQLDQTAKNSRFGGINLLESSGAAGKSWGRPYAGIITNGTSYANYDVGSGAGKMTFYLELHNVTSANVNINWGDGTAYAYSYSSGTALNDNTPIVHDYESGQGNRSMTYAITTNGPGGAGGTSGFHIPGINYQPEDTTNITAYTSGDTVSLTHKPMTSSDLGLDSLDSLAASDVLTAVEAAQASVSSDTASIGSQQNRVDRIAAANLKQADALEAAHGQLVDSDLTAESAHWQAEQVHQKLIQQSLAIANAAPKALLQLFN